MNEKPEKNTIYISMLGHLLVKIKMVRRKIRTGHKVKNTIVGCKELSEEFKKFTEERRNKEEE